MTGSCHTDTILAPPQVSNYSENRENDIISGDNKIVNTVAEDIIALADGDIRKALVLAAAWLPSSR